MSIMRLEDIYLAFGDPSLLDRVSLQIEPRERIFLIGRNGMGKSCLFKIMMGHLKPDDGQIYRMPGLKIAELSQALPNSTSMLVYDFVAEGVQEIGSLLKAYHHLIVQAPLIVQSPSSEAVNSQATPSEITQSSQSDQSTHDAERWLQELENVQKQIDAKQGWDYQTQIDTILTRLDLPPEAKINSLSGGWQRRAALARALVCQPDLLLLDEPTNHLDLAAIEWLEEFLSQYSGALLCITHDRSFLRRLSQRILELDRGKLTSWSCNYDQFLIKKEHQLDVESQQAKLFDKKLAKEEVWIRQGIKARRTRNEGRVRALIKLREERQQRRELQGKPSFNSNAALLSGELVVKADHVSYSIGDKCLIKDFSLRLLRGDKIALIGPNGVGKSTFLKMIVGELVPQTGTVALGTNLQIGYFDQMRLGINFELSALENVGGGRETILLNGKEKHIISYLSDFLFTPDQARAPVKNLSGGECNRLLLAKLFSLPKNLLILDEPTNDLDIETLELIEDILIDYQGTVLLVSHDRTFVDNIATSTLLFSGNGVIQEYVGGFKDIPAPVLASALSSLSSLFSVSSLPTTSNAVRKEVDKGVDKRVDKEESKEISKGAEDLKGNGNPIKVNDNQSDQRSKANRIEGSHKIRFNSKLKKELEELPEKIAQLEEKQHKFQVEIASPKFYLQEKSRISTTLDSLKRIETELQYCYTRWEELEDLKKRTMG